MIYRISFKDDGDNLGEEIKNSFPNAKPTVNKRMIEPHLFYKWIEIFKDVFPVIVQNDEVVSSQDKAEIDNARRYMYPFYEYTPEKEMKYFSSDFGGEESFIKWQEKFQNRIKEFSDYLEEIKAFWSKKNDNFVIRCVDKSLEIFGRIHKLVETIAKSSSDVEKTLSKKSDFYVMKSIYELIIKSRALGTIFKTMDSHFERAQFSKRTEIPSNVKFNTYQPRQMISSGEKYKITLRELKDYKDEKSDLEHIIEITEQTVNILKSKMENDKRYSSLIKIRYLQAKNKLEGLKGRLSNIDNILKNYEIVASH